MSSSTLVPVSDYLLTSYRPDRDYVDGVVLERNLGEKSHSLLQIAIASFLFVRSKEWGLLALTEQRVQVSPTRFRIPDITVLVSPFVDEQIITHPPFLCIEILSKDDTVNQMRERIDDYLRFGVSYVWVIDPRTQRCTIHTASGIQEVQDGVLRTSNPELYLPIRDLYEENFPP